MPASNVSFANMVYFSFVNFTTTGFGDIKPISGWARFATVAENILELIFTSIFFAIAIGRHFAAEPKTTDPGGPPDIGSGQSGPVPAHEHLELTAKLQNVLATAMATVERLTDAASTASAPAVSAPVPKPAQAAAPAAGGPAEPPSDPEVVEVEEPPLSDDDSKPLIKRAAAGQGS